MSEADNRVLTEFKEEIDVLIDTFKKKPTAFALHELSDYTFLRTMKMLYGPDFITHLHELTRK